ncbi:MAG: hypothetical protein IKC52_03740 [Clostridia bacterium]|nr:hypothetical protein [Clostridia bacterium]
MDILFYLFFLMLFVPFACGFAITLDYCLKSKHCKVVKAWKIVLKSQYDKSSTVSPIVFGLQIFNYLYVLAYLVIAIIESYFIPSTVLSNINVFSVLIYGGLLLLGTIIAGVLGYLFSDEKK